MLKKMIFARVVIHSSELIPMDDHTLNKSTSRFCLLDEKEIVAGGIVDIKKLP